MLSRFVIAFLPRSKCLLISWLQSVTVSSDFGVQENKICPYFHFSLIYLYKVKGQDAMIFVF